MSERFPELSDLPPVVQEILEFLEADEWWCRSGLHAKRFGAEKWEDTAQREVVDPIRAIICKHLGHRMTDDQCGRVEHDYCEVCELRRDAVEVTQ